WLVGIAAALLFASGLAIHHYGLVAASAWIMVFGFAAPVYATVSHRLLPFFTSNVLTDIVPWRPNWVLAVLLSSVLDPSLRTWEGKTLEQIGRSLNEVAEYAAGFGIAIRLEVHGPGTSLLPNVKKIMDVADNPGVVVCWNCNPTDMDGDGFVKRQIDAVKEDESVVAVVLRIIALVLGALAMRRFRAYDWP
ncbi:MAG: hypothetical protein HC793_01515, partial [Aquincola sp.]|nr:hypothetical protein [Aquincola sp.]